MLPKIAVGVFIDRKELLENLKIKENTVMGFEGEAAKVDDLRSWVNASINILRNQPHLSMVIWDADKLSAECQAVLLKPMEEFDAETNLILVVENENSLLPTILSRGITETVKKTTLPTDTYWNEIRKCWSSGPSACIAFVDSLEKEKATVVMEEIVGKLKDGLLDEINEKRLTILDMAITILAELKQTNINHKLSLGNFLISSWRIIKA